MFSGIVQEIGTVERVDAKQELLIIEVSCTKFSDKLEIGSSVAIDGCCQTIVEISKLSAQDSKLLFKVQVTEETINKTQISKLKIGSKVNLEPSLKYGESVDGHLVSGHIDGTGEVASIIKNGENTIVKIFFPKELRKFIVAKGSISVNGVSLTVVGVENCEFSFTLIPFTRDNTNLGLIKTGDLVNLEVDLISRYLVNYIQVSESFVQGKI